MSNFKGAKNPKKQEESMVFNSVLNRIETASLICDIFWLSVFIYDQVFYGLNMWPLILVLLAIGICIVLFGSMAERYLLTEVSLEVWRFGIKISTIPYNTVFNLEEKARDGFVNLLTDNRVKVYHSVRKSKRLTICRPKEVYNFVEELKKRCPEFEGNGQTSKLDIFFKK